MLLARLTPCVLWWADVSHQVSRRATVWDLKMEVAQAAGVSGDRLIMANITKHLIYDFVKDSMPVMRLRVRSSSRPASLSMGRRGSTEAGW